MPDSLLQDFCACINRRAIGKSHIIAANEGNAAAIAAGHYLATGEPALVYMQNSGIGNIVNPVTSLLDPKVYSIPVLFLIGWRGEPGINDEPQHVKQGEVTLDLLETLGIRYAILPRTSEALQPLLAEAIAYMKWNNAPFALVVSKDAFKPYNTEVVGGKGAENYNAAVSAETESPETEYPMNREEAIKLIIDETRPGDIIVSTTGKASREIFEYRESHERDFLTVGSMGHASQIALGIALAKPGRRVFCIDGDGALIMHLGGLAIIGDKAPPNYVHVVINNGAHESVGGQPTVGFKIDIPAIARACGYRAALRAEDDIGLKEYLKELNQKNEQEERGAVLSRSAASGVAENGAEESSAAESGAALSGDIGRTLRGDIGRTGPIMLEVRVRQGSRKNLGRPTTTPIENKEAFMKFLVSDK